MPATGQNIFDDGRLFTLAGVFFKDFMFFNYIEYYTVGLYILYKANLI